MLETEKKWCDEDCWLLDALLTKYFSRPSVACVCGIILLLNTNK